MTEELKTVVTIISVLVIVGIFGHGLWSIRKNKEQLRDLKQPKRNEPELNVKGLDSKSADEQSQSLDANGLDSHGVGVPRTVGGSSAKPATENNIPAQQPGNTEERSEELSQENSTAMPSFSADDAGELNSGDDATPAQSFTADDSQTDESPTVKSKSATKSQTAEPETAEPSEVLIVHVSMPDGQTISGASLLPLLISLGFKFGEMDIFHRHEDSAGHGAVLFSLASMYNPGTFDIDNIEQISTKGLSMFMTLPCKGEALANFNMMHNAAKKISEEFGGQLLDSNRSALTVQTVRHYVEKIREFERKRLING